MPTNYTVCDDSVTDLLADVVASTHPHLKKAGVTITCLFAHADPESGAAALNHAGYAALALVKLNALKQRVEGLADCTIYLDALAWEERDEAQRRAILDHEAAHLLLVEDKDGKLKRDDAGRPKMRLRKHDFHGGGFFDVIERHHGKAAEMEAFSQLHKELAQRFLFSDM